MKTFITTLSILIACFGIAYAQDEGQPAQSTRHDDLEKVKGNFKETWVHPDADFTKYSKVFLWEGEFQYRDVGPARRTRTTMMNTRKREFGISDADRVKFEQAVSEAFDAEFAKGKRYTIVDELGPDTMILRGAALDIVSTVPPDTIGRSEIYLSSIGEATLVVELMDAENGEVLALVAERRQLGSGRVDEFSMPANSVTVMSDVKRWARRAAGTLRSELDKAIAGK